ncbi:MAG TPA: AraC family transcriptional regulator [Candidatus Saccharimonadales bacterium]|nr:AraC family transcriptional regulator [Candidatus Saccharimonadales bacterium]
MAQIHHGRTSDHPFIDRVWETFNITDGVYSATPDRSWDLIMGVEQDGTRHMMLAGQATKAAKVPYRSGTYAVVISLTAGAYMPHAPGDTLLDSAEVLQNTDNDHFMLAGTEFSYPTFEAAEGLVAQMVDLGIIKGNDVVTQALNGQPKAMSKRAAQRHFIRTTGMTRKQLEQIERAQEAVKLLQQGKKPLDVAADAGYTDQSHLSKSLRRIMDAKPSGVDDIHKL